MNVVPPEGVPGFIKRFGGARHIVSALSSMGIHCTQGHITRWKHEGEIPEHFYHLLSSLIVNDETAIAKGFIEFYVCGKPIGKFYLHKNVTAVIRNRRTRK